MIKDTILQQTLSQRAEKKEVFDSLIKRGANTEQIQKPSKIPILTWYKEGKTHEEITGLVQMHSRDGHYLDKNEYEQYKKIHGIKEKENKEINNLKNQETERIIDLKNTSNIDKFLAHELEKRGMSGKLEELENMQKQTSVLRQLPSALGDVFLRAQKGFGETLGGATAVLTGTERMRREAELSEGESMDNIRKLYRKETDPIRKENLRKQLEQGALVPTAQEVIPGFDKTAKEIFGEGLGVAIDIASFGTYGAGAKFAQSGRFLTTAQKARGLTSKVAPASKLGAFVKGATTSMAEAIPIGTGTAVSQAMMDSKELKEIGIQAGLGALASGMVSGLIGGTFAKSKFTAKEKGLEMKRKAIERYRKGMQVSKEKYAEMQDKIIPDLVESGEWGTWRSLMKKADDGIELSAKEYEKLGELQGVIEINGLVGKIDAKINKLKTKAGTVITTEQSKFKTLEKLKLDILGYQDKAMIASESGIYTKSALQQDLRELAQIYGKELYDTRKALKTVQDNKVLSQVYEVDGMVRELLNTKNPEYAQINKLYTASTRLKDVLIQSEKTQNKQLYSQLNRMNSKMLSLAGIGAGGYGIASGSTAMSLMGAGFVASSILTNSTWWNTGRAVMQNRLANSLLRLPAKEMSKSMIIMSRYGTSAINKFLNYWGDNEMEAETN